MKKLIKKFLNKRGWYHLSQMSGPLRTNIGCYKFIKKHKHLPNKILAKRLGILKLTLTDPRVLDNLENIVITTKKSIRR